MKKNTRIRTAAALAVSAALTAAAAAPAVALPAAHSASAPRFLAPGDLPAASTPWTADPVRKGLPADESFCTAGTTPASGTTYRDFRTELDTGARQTTTVAATPAKAAQLADRLRQAVETCLDRLVAEYPGLEGEAFHHGPVDVEEGANVYSIDTHDPEVGSTDIALWSVGRDGRTVTVVQWGQLGDLDGAPLAAFKHTTATAVARLH
ncbi:hypothetical protein [Streptomyces genisteinicus]|uniref:Sensor domain-containing protein n=1 Tax=Streptomyces genisteinicus TaxID=2768068 RepID=A0A7H0HMS1_9ACTN|nr:hypothetical protein [Streptomyces genisteinicus]QNP61837.1 hypothetical protein IAG43_02125 [Streptomyces genisteinicus]